MQNPESQYFGAQATNLQEKPQLVDKVFSSVAHKYDVMNDLMSGGLHRVWKDRFVAMVAPQAGMQCLDVAGGTGDIALKLARKGAAVIVCDPSAEMLKRGRDRAMDKGYCAIQWIEGRAEALPFADASMDSLTISFGLRNVSAIDTALAEFARVLKPQGRMWCMEFTPVETPVLKQLYAAYSFGILPRLGGWVAGDRASYQYLAESIRAFPSRDVLAKRMEAAGFTRVFHTGLAAGIVAVHSGVRV